MNSLWLTLFFIETVNFNYINCAGIIAKSIISKEKYITNKVYTKIKPVKNKKRREEDESNITNKLETIANKSLRRNIDKESDESEPATQAFPSFDKEELNQPTMYVPANIAQRKTTRNVERTPPARGSVADHCDYYYLHCSKAYSTDRICGRTIYYRYMDFKNYCYLDYVNCMARYEVWQLAYMGECFNLTDPKDFRHYSSDDDKFLDEMYFADEDFG